MIMKSKRALVVLVLGLASTGAAGLACWVGNAAPGPVRSASVLQPPAPSPAVRPSPADRMPDDPTVASRTIDFWTAQAARDSQGALELRELAGAYLARLREAGDIADAVKAEDAARRSLKILRRGNSLATIRLSRALLAQHRFPEALEEAKRAARVEPEAGRVVIDALLELGDYAEAERLLADFRPDPSDLNSFALRARFEQVDGRPEAALSLLREACRLADDRPDMPAETVAWYHAMVGHALIDLGRLDEAEAACRAALAVFPRDFRALTFLANIAAWRGDWEQALARGQQAIAINPRNPEAFKLIGDAHLALDRQPEAERNYQLLKDLTHSFPKIYDRHWALFGAEKGRDLDEALALARNDLELRRDVHAYDTLAWVCFQKGMLPEAESAMQTALAKGTREATLFYHAGMIARASGDLTRAKNHFKDARAINPRSIPLRWIRWMESQDKPA